MNTELLQFTIFTIYVLIYRSSQSLASRMLIVSFTVILLDYLLLTLRLSHLALFVLAAFRTLLHLALYCFRFISFRAVGDLSFLFCSQLRLSNEMIYLNRVLFASSFHLKNETLADEIQYNDR